MFETDLERLQPALLSFAIQLTKNRTVALDLRQETCVRALTTHFVGGNYRSWLFTIMRHCWIDMTRAKKREREIILVFSAVKPEATPADATDVGVMIRDMQRALASISPAMADFAIRSATTTDNDTNFAGEAGVPIGTFRRRLHTARVEMRRYMEHGPLIAA